MNIKVVKKNKRKMEFILGGASISFANALRRIMISEVPVLAIEWLEIERNDSPIFDEILAQRMSLLPLVFDPKKFNFQADCKCKGKGCPLCQTVFILEKKGPGIAYSGNMKSSDKSVKILSDEFPITELMDNQDIKVEAVAVLGTGKDHAKYQAANAVYENYPEMDGKEINTNPDKFLFRIESISGLTPEYIVSKAAEILQEKAKIFKKETSKL